MQWRGTWLGVLAGLVCAPLATAATLLGTAEPKSDETFDLGTLGPDDWAYWSTGANPAGGAPTNERLGADMIGSIVTVGGGNLRGSTSSTQPGIDFQYSGGTSPATGTVSNPTGLFNSQLDANGAGLSLTITLPSTDTHVVHLWGAAFGDGISGEFTASLPGASTFTDSTLTDEVVGAKNSMLYILTVTPDNPNDVLTLSLVLQNESAGRSSEHVIITGAAVEVVPEPAATVLAALAAAATLMVRRRLR